MCYKSRFFDVSAGPILRARWALVDAYVGKESFLGAFLLLWEQDLSLLAGMGYVDANYYMNKFMDGGSKR